MIDFQENIGTYLLPSMKQQPKNKSFLLGKVPELTASAPSVKKRMRFSRRLTLCMTGKSQRNINNKQKIDFF